MTSLLAPYQPARPSSPTALRRPGNLLCPDGIVFDNLERAIQRHLFQLHALGDSHPRPPRFLVIAGKPGTGKTVAATDAALRMKHAVLYLPASDLASENEGGATAVLESYLEDAEHHAKTHDEPVVIIADDLDLGIITNDADTGRTVNSNLLIQRLQSLADGDEVTNADGSRIAVIITGNDWSSVRASLLRDGRASWFEHEPTPEEITALAIKLLRPRSAEDQNFVRKLARRHRHESIAFWSALATHLKSDLLDALMAAGVTDQSQIKVELNRPRPLDRKKLGTLARKHAARRRLSFL